MRVGADVLPKRFAFQQWTNAVFDLFLGGRLTRHHGQAVAGVVVNPVPKHNLSGRRSSYASRLDENDVFDRHLIHRVNDAAEVRRPREAEPARFGVAFGLKPVVFLRPLAREVSLRRFNRTRPAP